MRLIAIGNKMPAWVNTGFAEYAQRLPSNYQLQLVEVPAQKRTKGRAVDQVLQQEGEKLLAAAQPPMIALDRRGWALNTEELAKQLQNWHDSNQNPSLLIGGPEGLAPMCLKHADKVWSLSALTFPHALVRIILAEQIYRAWSILSHHPYHRS